MAAFTRQAIMQAFMKLLDERPLNRITVKDIVEACGINRNTFYYHFEDIPNLIEAIVKDEVDRILMPDRRPASPTECLEIAADYMLSHRKANLNLYHSSGRELYEHYVMELCGYIVRTYLSTLFAGRELPQEQLDILILSEQCQWFGLLMRWLEEGLTDEGKAILSRLCALRRDVMEGMLAGYIDPPSDSRL